MSSGSQRLGNLIYEHVFNSFSPSEKIHWVPYLDNNNIRVWVYNEDWTVEQISDQDRLIVDTLAERIQMRSIAKAANV